MAPMTRSVHRSVDSDKEDDRGRDDTSTSGSKEQMSLIMETLAKLTTTVQSLDNGMKDMNNRMGNMDHRLIAMENAREAPPQRDPPREHPRPRGRHNVRDISPDSEDGEHEIPRDHRRRDRDRAPDRERYDDKNLKQSLPEFHGKTDPETYLEWETNVDKLFSMNRYSEDYKVKASISEFRGNANHWWLDLNRRRRRDGLGNVVTWVELKREMRTSFVPRTFHRRLRSEFQDLRQGVRTAMEFYYELVAMRTKLQLDETDEAMEARFLRGLNSPLRDLVEREALRCRSLEEILEYADLIEKQLKTKDLGYSKFNKGVVTPPSKVSFSKTPTTFPKFETPLKQEFKTTTSSVPKKVFTPPSTPQERRVQCFKCKGYGHYARDCVNQRVMTITEDGEIYSEDEMDEKDSAKVMVELAETSSKVKCHHSDYSSEEEGQRGNPPRALVVRRALSAQSKEETSTLQEQRTNLFHVKCRVLGKACLVIVDSGSCTNAISEEFVKKLALKTSRHPRPYKLQWIGNSGEIRVKMQAKVPIKFDDLLDEVTCDVLPMDACHILLGRPWQFDKKAMHDGFTNEYTFRINGINLIVQPMSPGSISRAHEYFANKRERERRQERELKKPIESNVSEVTSESKKPQVSEKRGHLLLTTKRDIEEVLELRPPLFLLILHGFCLTNSTTHDDLLVPSIVKHVLKEFEDVFPEELPHGLPPIRGIEHQIDFIPGSSIPNRPSYKANPMETKEL